MSLKRVLGALLVSRMAGRGARRGGLGGMLGGRRGGLAGKAGLGGLAYMAYQAYQAQQTRASDSSSIGNETGSKTSAGIGGILGDLASRFGGGSEQGDSGPMQFRPAPEDERAAAAVSDDKALLLIRAMIAAAQSDGTISPDERTRVMQQLDDAGANSEDRRRVEQEIENPKSLDDLLLQVTDEETSQEFYLASSAAIDGETEAERSYLVNLRQRLGLSEADAAEIEGLA